MFTDCFYFCAQLITSNLSLFLYNIFLVLFSGGIRVASLFHPKAAQWVRGRKGIFEKLKAAIPVPGKIIWVHCASLGEFEQGRPVIESLRAQYPGYRILLTFFSPSGYEVQKNYSGADWVFYLPPDGPRNARRFLEIVQPSLVIFVKYEFWYYYLKKIKYREIPLLLISALFRKDMSFFKWYGSLQRKILSRFDHLFVQNSSSLQLLEEIGLGSISSISGDTRFDRVSTIAAQWSPVTGLEAFAGKSRLIVAGSTWPDDEILLQEALTVFQDADCKLVIAPHELSGRHLQWLEGIFPGAIRYSALQGIDQFNGAKYLVIDNIGMLSRLYQYAWCTYIGGGLRKSGIHNVLEAAVYHKPVFFGPRYTKYSEAVELVSAKGAIPVQNGAELAGILGKLKAEPTEWEKTAAAAGTFVQSHTGAVARILDYIQEKRLLTS